jgi:hypothetical protein
LNTIMLFGFRGNIAPVLWRKFGPRINAQMILCAAPG